MIEKIKKFGAWLYNWATVVAGIIVGGLSYGLDALDAITGTTDLTPILPPDQALKIVTLVALIKGAHAYYKSR